MSSSSPEPRAPSPQDQRGCRDVFDRDANRFEERNLLVVAPAGSESGNDSSDLRQFTPRGDDIPRFAQRRLTRVDENTGGGDEIVVQLAPVGAGRADRIDMGAWSKPGAAQHGGRGTH